MFAGLGWITVTEPGVVAGWAPKGVDVLRKSINLNFREKANNLKLRGKQKRYLRRHTIYNLFFK